jgi:hypothetical protein
MTYKGLYLADLCERVGSRPYVAHLLRVPRERLEAYITGAEIPPREFLRKFARVAHIRLHEILPPDNSGRRAHT